MNFGSIKLADCANGPGMRTSLFVSGCRHHCKGCFNEQTWDFRYGEPYTPEVEEYILETLKPSVIDGLSILGGEPLEPENQKAVLQLVKRVKQMGKTVWVYTGFYWVHLRWDRLNLPGNIWRCSTPYIDDILDSVDVLVDGPFIEEKKDISLRFRGSSNQSLIDVKKTLEKGEIVLWEERK